MFRMKIERRMLAIACALLAAGCVTSPADDPSSDMMIEKMLSGRSNLEGDALETAVAAAQAYPLGSERNPVRTQGPVGQRAYLSRLRCADLRVPGFERAGSAGVSPYGNIADLYRVDCGEAEPGKRDIYLDMYHAGHRETRAVPGFGMVGGRSID